jgi:AcrR family transcriptional regulator
MDQEIHASRVTPRYARKREAILQAAAQLFNQHGVKGAMLSDVANRVGLSTNSITYYYRKKEDLVVACLLRSIDVINSIIPAAAEAESVEDRVRQFILRFFNQLARIQRGCASEMMSFRDLQVLGSPHAELVFSAYTDMFRRVRRLLASDGASKGNRVSLNARTHRLLTLTVGAMNWSARYDPLDYEPVAVRMSDILIGGLASPASRWASTALDSALAQAPDTGDAIQEAFLRAATALLNEQGYRGASVERISARLNVSKGSFYHHVPNKEDLISACFERTFAVTRRMQLIARAAEGSGWDKLCAVSRGLVRYQFSERGPLLRMSAWSELPDDIREDKLRVVNQLGQGFVGFLVDGMQDGSIRLLDQSLAALLVSGMINASVVLDRWVPDMSAENAVELFVKPLFLGIQAV